MSMLHLAEAPTPSSRDITPSQLLGGDPLLKHGVSTPLDAHELIMQGIPGLALVHLIESLDALSKSASFENALGMSLRTFQRRKSEPEARLSIEQSARLWVLAETLAKAITVFGSQAEAERWMLEPAIGLDQHKPIDLMATPVGGRLVDDLLERMRYGVYM